MVNRNSPAVLRASLALAGTLVACGGSTVASGAIRVVTAFYPIQLVAERLGGDAVAVSNLTPAGAEPHDLELRPSDLRAVRAAHLILYFGDGFQPALDGAIATLRDKRNAIDLLDGLDLKPAGDGSTADPHVWLSPLPMRHIVDAITGELSSRLPSQAPQIRARAAALKTELDALDAEYRAKLAHCERREIFTSHAAFAYLADRYGLRQVAITGLSPESEPSPKRLQDIARQARQARATTIFFETLVSPRVSQSVARSVGARTAVLDPIEGLTPEQASAGADYFSIMRKNLTALGNALGCRT